MTSPRILNVAFLLIAVAATLSAQPSTSPISIDPPDPTSSDSVTLFVQQFDSCPPPPVVSRTGFAIDVTVNFGPCMFPPELITHEIELGALPAGRYDVRVTYGSSPVPEMFSFVVLDANRTVKVSQSIGSSAGGTVVNVEVEAAHCLNQPPDACPPPSITFGGVPASEIVVIDQSHFRATTPPHAAGAVEVTVADAAFTKSSYSFRYVDPMVAPSSKFFEKILLPVIFNGPGAFGSKWVTELALRNNNAYSVEPWRAINNSFGIPTSTPVLFGSASAPSGLFVVVPRQAADGLAFHAAIRDTSRSDVEWATEIPVVREREFSKVIDLLDIPTDPRFRTMLRVYSPANAVPAYGAFLHVIVYSLEDGTMLREFYPSLLNPAGCTDAVSCAEHPSYVAMPDIAADLLVKRVGVQVQAYVPIWAFVTITNNDTQHVTVVSPQ